MEIQTPIEQSTESKAAATLEEMFEALHDLEKAYPGGPHKIQIEVEMLKSGPKLWVWAFIFNDEMDHPECAEGKNPKEAAAKAIEKFSGRKARRIAELKSELARLEGVAQ